MNQTTTENQDRFPIEHIRRMVESFYDNVRQDPQLGPLFAQKVSNWPEHLDRMVLFWRAVLRSEPTFKMSERGSPPVLHRQIDGLSRAHFDRWLTLFDEVVNRIFSPEYAADICAAARRIASALSRHIPSQQSSHRELDAREPAAT